MDIELPFLPDNDKHSKSIKSFIDACLGREYDL